MRRLALSYEARSLTAQVRGGLHTLGGCTEELPGLTAEFSVHHTALLVWFPGLLARHERPKKEFLKQIKMQWGWWEWSSQDRLLKSH